MNREEWRKKGAGHRHRLRRKFLERGIESFSDDEVLELLLVLGTPRKDCKEPARDLLKRFKTLPAVLDASPAELRRTKGVGPNNSFALHFLHEVSRRYLRHRLVKKDYLHSSQEVADFLIHAFRDRKRELFVAIYLDAGHAIIDTEVVARGTINVNTVYPRELIKQALSHNAAALVIAHNHPSGSLKPSNQDLHLTRTLYQVCSFMNIELLDHLIIGAADRTYSFADHGLMADIRSECRQL